MSTVRSIRSHVLDVPQPTPISSSYATYASLGVVAVEIETDDGRVGHGWTNVIGGGAQAIESFVRTELVPLVVGTRPTDVRKTWQAMFMHSISRGRKGIAMYGLSAIDIALWDLIALEADMPLHQVLGAYTDAVPVYGDGCWLSYTHEELAEAATAYASRGFWGVKVKVGVDIDDAIERIGIVRDVVGPRGRVMVDANQRFDLIGARTLDRRMEAYNVTWFEEPLLADSIHDYARLAGTVTTPIAAGENEYTRFGFRELIEHEAVDVLQPDVHRVGGVTEFMRIAALAETWNIPVAPHTSWELHSQLLPCVTTGMAVEYFDWFPADFFGSAPTIEAGMAQVSTQPGHGVRFGENSLERYAV